MPDTASDLARRLARDAKAVCRHHLPGGRRQGHYRLVGDVENSPGRSLHVRLRGPGSGKGAAGEWTDAAAATHGRPAGPDRHPRAPDRVGRHPGRGATLSRPAAARTPGRSRDTSTDRPTRSGTTAVGDLQPGPRHDRGDVSPQPRQYDSMGLHVAQVPPALLPSARPGTMTRLAHRLPRADRRRHRPRGHDHRLATPLARSCRQRKGRSRHAAAGDG